MDQLSVERSKSTAVPTLELQGSVDVQSKDLLREQLNDLISEGHPHIRVDLGGITYLGSVGLAVLIEASKRMRKRGARLSIVPGPKQLRKHLALLNLESVLDFEEPLT